MNTKMKVTKFHKVVTPDDYGECPNCGLTLKAFYHKYCFHCGQELDWGPDVKDDFHEMSTSVGLLWEKINSIKSPKELNQNMAFELFCLSEDIVYYAREINNYYFMENYEEED